MFHHFLRSRVEANNGQPGVEPTENESEDTLNESGTQIDESEYTSNESGNSIDEPETTINKSKNQTEESETTINKAENSTEVITLDDSDEQLDEYNKRSETDTEDNKTEFDATPGSNRREKKLETKSSKYNMSFSVDNFLKIVPMFDGKPSEVHRFLSCCQVVHAPLITPEARTQFIELLKARTSGRAYDVLRYKKFTDFDTLSKEFQKQFLPKKSLGQLQTQLISARQFHTESVCEFSNRIEQFLSDINSVSHQTDTDDELPATILQFNEQTALTAFQEGLKEPIKTIVKACRFKELNAAITFAVSEDTLSPNRVQLQKKNFNCNSCGKPGHFAKDCKVKFCEYCKKSGHVSRECRNKNSNVSKTPGRVNHIEIECRYCKKKGHVIENCRRWQYNNSQSHSTRSENQPERDSTSNEIPAHNLQ